MQTLKSVFLISFILTAAPLTLAAGKKKLQMSVQPVTLAVSFETYDKNKQLLNTFSFDGEQKSIIVGDVKNTGNFKCECSGQFEIVPINGQKYVASFFTFNCGENDQKTKSQVGRLLIPVKDYQSFSKTIFLHKNQPEVVLKIKELSL
ncbi:hypothetical protein CIK05_08395 [Bdellovibrio sp. qaytius]|nr:hypothetical protein CIK05_08395 [Bdellovibrio sp. qaytius]